MCREVSPREHLSTERIVQYTVLLWRNSHLIPDIISQSERSLGTVPTQVSDNPSSTLKGLEEDEEITADTQTYIPTNRIVTLCPSLYPTDTGWEKKQLVSK